jgi:hypothetical protein
MNVLVCDDSKAQCAEIAKNIREAGQPEPNILADKELTVQLTRLFDDIRACLEDPSKFDRIKKTAFDGVDLVILDNNLAHLEIPGARLTAETIAGYVRAFTKVTYIVSLNLNPDVDFDLRYLVGDYSTRADLALNINHLANPGLWTGDQKLAKDGFLPWYWPALATVAGRRMKQIEFVAKRLGQSVAEALGFSDEAVSFLSLHARGALSPEAVSEGKTDKESIPFNKLTFRNVFVSKERSLPIKGERQRLSDAEAKGNAALRDIIARVVAADMDLWFRRDVVAPQEPLVDVPHLLMRFPFLLGARAKDLDAWNGAVGTNTSPYGLEKNLYYERLHQFKYEHDIWVKNACVYWPKLKSDEKLNSLLVEAKEGEWADVVFCEDRSAFLERETTGQAPIEFPAEFESSWERRYVAKVSGYKYSPRSRLAM